MKACRLLLRVDMEYKANDIMKLLAEVAREAGVTLQYASFGELYSKIEEKLEEKEKIKKMPFTERYLYKQVYQPLLKLNEKNDVIRLNANNVEHLIKYLSYLNYDQFIKAQSQPVHAILKNYINTSWYSYVRCNSGEDYVLVSPVRIYNEGREIILLLKGPNRTFTGNLKYEGNCLCCHLVSQQDKDLHLVFYAGLEQNPRVIQGVFSGISSAGDPIAGREVLVRQDEKFNMLQNFRRPIQEMLESKSAEAQIIAMYFKNPEHNILKAGKASTFSIGDLKIR